MPTAKIILVALAFLALMNVSINVLYPLIATWWDDRSLRKQLEGLRKRKPAIAGKPPRNVELKSLSQEKNF